MRAEYPFAAVLFDLDGVVVDTTELHYRVWDEFARERGYKPSKAELLATNGRRAGETVRAWLGAKLNEREVETLTADREAHFNRLLASEPVAPVAGVEAYLAALKKNGIPRAVATSAVPQNAELALSRAGLADAFGAIITAADVRKGKPDREPYMKAAAALGVLAIECVVIEDSASGIRSAKAAGAKCVALTTTLSREMLAPERPDWIAGDFLNLPKELWP